MPDTVRFFTAILTRYFDAHLPVWCVAQVKDALAVAATGWVHVQETERTAIIDEICLRYGIDKEGKES